MYHLSPLTTIPFHILLHYLLNLYFMSINDRPLHPKFILSTSYTSSFITIAYKLYNVNTNQITIKINHHNPTTIIHTSQTDHLPSQFYDNSLLFSYNHHHASSSSCRAASTDIPDPLSPHLPIIHRLWLVLRVTSRIIT